MIARVNRVIGGEKVILAIFRFGLAFSACVVY